MHFILYVRQRLSTIDMLSDQNLFLGGVHLVGVVPGKILALTALIAAAQPGWQTLLTLLRCRPTHLKDTQLTPSIDDWKQLRADISSPSVRWKIALSTIQRLLGLRDHVPQHLQCLLSLGGDAVEPNLLREKAIELCTLTAFGLFLWSTGCARQTIDALFRCALSVGYDSVQSHIEASADFCMHAAANIVQEPHSFEYDNLNVSRSIFYEQVGERGVGKVTSGTFGLFCRFWNAKREHMLLAPMMKRFRALAGLQYNRDIRPSLDHLASYLDQVTILVVSRLAAYEEEFEWISKHPDLQHIPRRPIPVGYKTKYYPLRASTIEEATTPSPSVNMHINPWGRREVFQLGFGMFHACLNLVWAILHTHRGSVNDAGSLAYFFALMEKTRLGNDQPDYHTYSPRCVDADSGWDHSQHLAARVWVRDSEIVHCFYSNPENLTPNRASNN
ncbi:hypothetical protein R3P38DRAFT_3235482 [Favolaschia claudopus]|uniref:DUF6589 domain-containing protein n=1 Tax=Favolaschia claudopus TaxID=2862362 RepID=A0AAV9ZDS8_9AGAR